MKLSGLASVIGLFKAKPRGYQGYDLLDRYKAEPDEIKINQPAGDEPNQNKPVPKPGSWVKPNTQVDIGLVRHFVNELRYSEKTEADVRENLCDAYEHQDEAFEGMYKSNQELRYALESDDKTASACNRDQLKAFGRQVNSLLRQGIPIDDLPDDMELDESYDEKRARQVRQSASLRRQHNFAADELYRRKDAYAQLRDFGNADLVDRLFDELMIDKFDRKHIWLEYKVGDKDGVGKLHVYYGGDKPGRFCNMGENHGHIVISAKTGKVEYYRKPYAKHGPQNVVRGHLPKQIVSSLPDTFYHQEPQAA